ncbi:MAG: hypothetical protein ACRD3R_17765 [Terriglobales bacterium]
MADDLSSVRDDMIAFIEGHGLQRFHGYVGEDVSSVMWDEDEGPDSWKDFVELAKASGAPFLIMHGGPLEQKDWELLLARLRKIPISDQDDIEEARWLRSYIGKTGFLQLGFAHQGVVLLYEQHTEWYRRYQWLLDLVEEMDGPVGDEAGADDEEEER